MEESLGSKRTMPKATREIRKTVFGFGEGETENIFLKHLRSLYSAGKTHVTIDHAGGKAVTYILAKANRIRSFNSYNHSFILLDSIPTWPSASLDFARKNNFELIGSEPCIEAIFLKILTPAIDLNGSNSQACKRRFCDKHLNGRRLISDSECKRLFLKSRLDSARTQILRLDRVIQIIEGAF